MQMMAGNAGSSTRAIPQAKVPINNYSNPTNSQIMQAQKRSYHNNYTAPNYSKPKPSTPSYGGNSNYYTVQSGDTLSGIAAKYGVNWNDLASWNNISNPNRISVGQRINLHGASAKKSVPTTRNSGSALPVAKTAPRKTVAPSKPKVPTTSAPNPPTNNGFQDATLADVAKKYGIDISNGYADNQAASQYKGKHDSLSNSLTQDKADYNQQLQMLADAFSKQQDSINEQSKQNKDLNAQNLKVIADTLNSGLANTDQSYFLKGLDQAQAQENSGINDGIASDQNLRLAMNKQNAVGALDNTASQQKGAENSRYAQQVTALADAIRQANADYTTQKQGAYNTYTGQTKDLQSQLADLAQQQSATSQQIRQQQITQALAQMNTENARNDQNNQFAQSQAWQKYTYTHMSAAEKAQFDQNAKQFGQQMAWNIEQEKQQLASYNSAYTGFNNGSGGGGATYQHDLSAAQQYVQMDPSQLGAFNWVIQHESSFNPSAQNKSSTAHGYAQFLNSTQAQYDKKMGLNYNGSGAAQLAEAYQYMVDRYGNPTNAMKFWQTHHWY